MTVAVVIAHIQEARSLVHWAALLGRARTEGVVVLFLGSKLGKAAVEEVATGAALLFFANIVAIVLGSALSLFVAGVRSEHLHRRQETWARRLAIASFVVAAIVAVLLCFWLHRMGRHGG